MAPVLAILAVIEAIRFAEFRSRLYVVTEERILVLGGILHLTLRGDLERRRIRGMQLIGTEPAVATEERKLLLTGLDPVDLESVNEALGGMRLLPPIKLRPRAKWRRSFAALIAVLFAAFAEGEGVVQRRSEAEFQRTCAKLRSGIGAAEAAIVSELALATGETVARRSGELEVRNPFRVDARFESRIDIERFPFERAVSVETRCERTVNLTVLRPTVRVLPGEGSANARFLEELRKELARLGIEAEWPR